MGGVLPAQVKRAMTRVATSSRVVWVLQASVMVLLCALSSGCLKPQYRSGSGLAAGGVVRVEPGPFAPTMIRVHPLTHLDTNERGEVVLLVHVQMRDRWSDVCKGTGTIQFFLYQPTGLGGAGQEEQVLRWEVSLDDLDANAVFFDPATQTYRFSLRNLPSWVQQMARSGDGATAGPGRFRLLARFATPKPEGGHAVLVDELVISR